MHDTRPHKPTDIIRGQIMALASVGVPQDRITKIVGIGKSTLLKYYSNELSTTSLKTKADIAKFLVYMATGQALETGATHADCLRAAMFLAKTGMGLSENAATQINQINNGDVYQIVTGVPNMPQFQTINNDSSSQIEDDNSDNKD